MTIREEKGDGEEVLHQKETTLEGPLTIFNLHKNKSKLFVGSFPVNYDMQKEIDANSFDGEIEDLVIGEKPVSLWNFNNGFENNHGAVERDKLVNLHPSTGYRFNGNGYAVLDVRSYPFRSKSDIKLSFKTFATEGLLFLTGRGNTFIAIELRNGKILYQVSRPSFSAPQADKLTIFSTIWDGKQRTGTPLKLTTTVNGTRWRPFGTARWVGLRWTTKT